MIINSNKFTQIKSTLISSKIACNFGLENLFFPGTVGIPSHFSPLTVS